MFYQSDEITLANFDIKVIVKEINSDRVLLVTENGQEIAWPRDKFPDDMELGSHVRLSLSTEKSEAGDRDKISKTVLNQLLTNDNGQSNTKNN